jgi:hypothetical protein
MKEGYMAHAHDAHTHEVDVVERSGYGAGMMVAVATLLVLVVLGIVLLIAQPWDDGNGGTTPNVPGVGDNGGGGNNNGGGTTDGNNNSGSGGATDGGSGGGAQQPAQ